MRFRPITVAVLAIGLLALTACAADGGTGAASPAPGATPAPPTGPAGPSSTAPSRPPDETPPTPTRRSTAPPISGVEPALEPYVARARADLAQRLGLPAAQVELVASALITWPDTALGCPRAGMSYPQVPTDGSVIELRAGGTTYRYHSGGSTPPFLCQP